MSDRTSLKNDAVLYMKDNGILEKLQPLAVAHSMPCLSASPYKPLILDFEIDLILLFNCSMALYKHLVEFPADARWIFEEALIDALRSFFEKNNCRLYAYIQLLLRCKIFDDLEDASSAYAKSYGCLSAARQYILTSVMYSPPDKSKVATICVLYRCPDSTCNGYNGKHRSMEQLEVIGHDNCDYCGKKCIEDLSGRGQVRKVMAKFMPAKAFGQSELRKPYRALTCSITDPLAKELELGDMYSLCGRHNGPVYDIWGLNRSSFFKAPAVLSFSTCPPSIRALKASLSQAEQNNPWSFIRKLALELGTRVYRQKAAASLKVGLLLSLASLGSDRCAPVLCVGSNIDILEDDVMSYAAKCADRNVLVTFPVSSAIEKSGDEIWQHTGSLMKAKTGVCNVGNWKILKSAQKNELLEVLDDGYIATGRKNSKATGSVDVESLPQPLPLKTAIWTHYTCQKNSGREKSDCPTTLINLFGMPFYTDGNEHNTETISEAVDLMVIAITRPKEVQPNKVPRNELIKFLRIVNAIEVTLTEDAVKLMKDYFVACRKARGDVFPAQSITFMTTLAEAHARLCLRTEATYDDVTTVIYLYEESMCYLYGFSVSTPPPFMEQGADNIGEKMETFKSWLKAYLKNLV